MGVILVVVFLVAGVLLYDYFTARRWQQVTSGTRNEIVFANRNKEYGAYALRRDYDLRMVLIMASIVATIGLTFGIYNFIKNMPEEVVEEPKISMENFTVPAEPEEDVPPPPEETPPPPTEETVQFTPPVIVDIPVDDVVPPQDAMVDTKADTKTQEGDDESWTPPVVGDGEKKEEVVEKKEEPILDFIEEDAEFPGGAAAMQKWIASNVKYPQTSIELGEQGKVYVSFVVEPDGSISGVQVERGVSDDLDKEAKRLVRSMPNWKAGKNNGQKVRARCRLPINFTLN